MGDQSITPYQVLYVLKPSKASPWSGCRSYDCRSDLGFERPIDNSEKLFIMQWAYMLIKIEYSLLLWYAIELTSSISMEMKTSNFPPK